MMHPTAINIALLTERGNMVHPTAINIALLTERGTADWCRYQWMQSSPASIQDEIKLHDLCRYQWDKPVASAHLRMIWLQLAQVVKRGNCNFYGLCISRTINAANPRQTPNGSAVFKPSLPRKASTAPAAAPQIEPISNTPKAPCQPRKAPMPAIIFISPRPIPSIPRRKK